MYDATGSGSYIDAVLYANGISDDQLRQNLCSRLHSKINETNQMCSVDSKNRSARGRGRYLLCTSSIPELAGTPPKKETFRLQSKKTLPSINHYMVCYR